MKVILAVFLSIWALGAFGKLFQVIPHSHRCLSVADFVSLSSQFYVKAYLKRVRREYQ